MNKVILIGRLTAEPSTRYGKDKNGEDYTVSQYTLAVDRRGSDEADFIQCNTFGKAAEFATNYLHKGMKVAIEGSIKTGSYTDKDGKKIYTTCVNVTNQEFCEKKVDQEQRTTSAPAQTPADCGDGFMNIPEGIDEDLPFAGPR